VTAHVRHCPGNGVHTKATFDPHCEVLVFHAILSWFQMFHPEWLQDLHDVLLYPIPSLSDDMLPHMDDLLNGMLCPLNGVHSSI
jgi:hypothetical protein